MKINKRGYWEGSENLPHGVDSNLAVGLKAFFIEESRKLSANELYIADLGCGTGYYTNELNDSNGELFCIGYDGNPNTKDVAGDQFEILDLSKPISDREFVTCIVPYDWVLCLEVGEHIPQEFEQVFLNNLVTFTDYGIVLSWAIEFQGGDGHVNCRNNDYIINEMSKRGFEFDNESTQWLRDTASIYPNTGWWFHQSLMVFRRRKQYA